ncbi:MAG: metallophosphatase family protein [Thermoleophilia bacterium]|nr:metallophosphatase family protein [Thermoleophilia bacterium]
MTNRLAVLGDIHANGPALDACLEDIREHGLTAGVCTGDLVMRGSAPEHCVQTLRGLGWLCVMGNTDRKVAFAEGEPGKKKLGNVGNRWWTRAHLGTESIRFLKSLPLVQKVVLGGQKVAVLHGTPHDPTVAMNLDASDKDLLRLAQDLDADCVISGHTHRPFQRRVRGHLFLNPGSVGETRNGDRRPSWAWLEADANGLTAHLERSDRDLASVRP